MKILALGDSHTEIFKYISSKKLIPNIDIDIFAIPGATAQGITNVNSETQALSSYRKKVLDTKGQYEYCILMLGEVDCGFAIWYRAEQHKLKIQDQLDYAIKQYTSFVNNDLKPIFNNNIIICGAHLPVLKNDKDNNDLVVQRARMTVTLKATQKQRTDLTLKYNNILKDFAIKNKYLYGDITRFCINKSTNLIKDELTTTGNHHLPIKLAADYWEKELLTLL